MSSVGKGVDPRSQIDSIVPLASEMVAKGEPVAAVMHAVYGVDLPNEAYAFYRAFLDGMDLPVAELFHPWELIDIADGNPVRGVISDNEWSREQEENAYAQAPRFLPLMQLNDADAIHGEHVIGYDLDALADGKATILGCAGDVPASGLQLVVMGPSLLDVLHEWAADIYRMRKAQFESPTNRGAGALPLASVEEASRNLQMLEDLMTKVSQSGRAR
jgi:hypothetical protein